MCLQCVVVRVCDVCKHVGKEVRAYEQVCAQLIKTSVLQLPAQSSGQTGLPSEAVGSIAQ